MRHQSKQRYGLLSRDKALANKRSDRTTDFMERVAMGSINSGRDLSPIEKQFIAQHKEKQAEKALTLWRTTHCLDGKLTESAIRQDHFGVLLCAIDKCDYFISCNP